MHVLTGLLWGGKGRGKKLQYCFVTNSSFQETHKIFIFQDAFASAADHPTDEWTETQQLHELVSWGTKAQTDSLAPAKTLSPNSNFYSDL